jgi:signal transduction histidine kinase
MDWWTVTAAAHAFLAVAFLAIFFLIARGLVPGGEWRRNALASSTAAIFFTGALAHGARTAFLVAASHVDGRATPATAVGDLPGFGLVAALDLLAAVATGLFLVQRLMADEYLASGNQMYEDLRERRQAAMDLNDEVIQGIVTAKLALDLDDHDEARLALERTLASSRQLVRELLGPAGAGEGIAPGQLRRGTAARVR